MSIECRAVSKAYTHRWLFNDLNIVFPSGICNCIMGENGSGKTTLLRILAGLAKANSGEVIMAGTCTYAASNPYMMRGSAAYNIGYPLTLRRQGGRLDTDLVDGMLDRLGLSERKDQEACTLSAGEKQKVALGRALIWNPDILILDEPTANIDSGMIVNIENLLLDYVKNPNHTLIMVSHDSGQAQRLSGMLWVLKAQKLAQEMDYNCKSPKDKGQKIKEIHHGFSECRKGGGSASTTERKIFSA